MTMSQGTLKDELVGMGLFGEEAPAIAAWAAAFRAYMADAEAPLGGVPINTAALGAPETAMAGAMAGLSNAGQAAAKIAAGITAFWGAMAASPAVYFTGATAITPPAALTGLAAALAATFAANVSSEASASEAYDAIATDIDTANTGGTATFPGPVVQTIE